MLRRLPAGSRAASHRLTNLQGPDGDGATVSVGRSQDSDVVLEDELFPLLISRNHAILKRTGRSLFLQDRGSTNGSFVNEERVGRNESRRVLEGDTISFGGPRRVLHTATGAPVEHPNPFIFQLVDCQQLFSDTVVQRATQQQSLGDLWDDDDILEGYEGNFLEPSPARTPARNNVRGRSHSRVPQQVHIDLTLEDEDSDELPTRLKRRASKKRERSSLVQEVPVDLEAIEDKPEAAAATSSAAPPAAEASKAKTMMEKMEEQFECQICRDFMVATHSMVPCGHMACAECLGDWLLKKPNCPSCRAPATAAPVPSLKVDNLLTDFVEPMLNAEDREERERRKVAWDRRAPQLNAQLKDRFSRAGGRGAIGGLPNFLDGSLPPHLPPGVHMDQLLGQFLMMRGRIPPPPAELPSPVMRQVARRGPRARGRWGPGGEVPPHMQLPAPPAATQLRGFSVAFPPRRAAGVCGACRGALLSNQPAVCRTVHAPSDSAWYHLHCKSQIPGFMMAWEGTNGNLPGMAALTPAEQARVRGMVRS